MRKMENKFHLADEDKDGKMDRDEYVNFEHPEETEHMTDVALDEILDEVDQNDDRWEDAKTRPDNDNDVRNGCAHHCHIPISHSK